MLLRTTVYALALVPALGNEDYDIVTVVSCHYC